MKSAPGFRWLLFGERVTSPFVSIGLLVLRGIGGFGLVLHGLPKLASPTGWLGPDIPGGLQFLAVVSEVGGGIALILGLLVPVATLGIGATMLVGVLLGHVASHDPLYRLTVSPTNEGPGTAFYDLPLWLVKAGGQSSGGSGSAELAILYLIIAVVLFFTGAGCYSLDRLLHEKKIAG